MNSELKFSYEYFPILSINVLSISRQTLDQNKVTQVTTQCQSNALRHCQIITEAEGGREKEYFSQGVFCMANHGEPSSPLPYCPCWGGQKLHAHAYSRPGTTTGVPKVKSPSSN